jgi:hypothetical protein
MIFHQKVCFVLWFGVAFCGHAFATQTVVTTTEQPRCSSLNLTNLSNSTDPKYQETLKGLEDFAKSYESAFKNKDSRLFQSLTHPALSRETKRSSIFNETILEYGLDKASLARTSAFLLHLPRSSLTQATNCSIGTIRGVVGPENQAVLIHTFLGGNEQIRLFTIVAPVPASFQKGNTTQWGVVMMHTQVWTHGRKIPQTILEEARVWKNKGQPLVYWAKSNAALRILQANPYFEPNDLEAARQEAAAALAQRPQIAPLNTIFQEQQIPKNEWTIEDYAVVFQAQDIEFGVKVRMNREFPVNEQIENCKKTGRAIVQQHPTLQEAFSGFECLTFGKDEKLESIPLAGSQFHTWKSLVKK